MRPEEVRVLLKDCARQLRCAMDTYNREAASHYRRMIRSYWSYRHQNVHLMYNMNI